jgi:hypothetical protein
MIPSAAPYDNENLRHEKACSGAQKRVFHARKQHIAGTEAAKIQGGTGEKGKRQ